MKDKEAARKRFERKARKRAEGAAAPKAKRTKAEKRRRRKARKARQAAAAAERLRLWNQEQAKEDLLDPERGPHPFKVVVVIRGVMRSKIFQANTALLAVQAAANSLEKMNTAARKSGEPADLWDEGPLKYLVERDGIPEPVLVGEIDPPDEEPAPAPKLILPPGVSREGGGGRILIPEHVAREAHRERSRKEFREREPRALDPDIDPRSAASVKAALLSLAAASLPEKAHLKEPVKRMTPEERRKSVKDSRPRKRRRR